MLIPLTVLLVNALNHHQKRMTVFPHSGKETTFAMMKTMLLPVTLMEVTVVEIMSTQTIAPFVNVWHPKD